MGSRNRGRIAGWIALKCSRRRLGSGALVGASVVAALLVPTAAVATAPANTEAPSISGKTTQGHLLTADPGAWSDSPSSYSYQWQRCPTSYSTAVLADGPVGFWRLNESSTSSAVADSSGNGNTGSYGGGVTVGVTSVPVSTEPDTAASFNGSTGYVDIPNSASLNSPSTGLSIEAWVKPSASYSEPIVLKSYTSHVAPYYQYGLFENGSAIRMDVTLGGTRVSASSSGTSLTIGSWNYVVATWDGSTIRFYINGVAAGTAAAAGTLSTYATPVTLATYENLRTSGSSYFWGGTMDEAAVYAKALSAAQISAHYAAATSAPTGCSDIAGGTSATYTPGSADVGSALQVAVTASNADGSATATSAKTAAVSAATLPSNSTPPVITGTPTEGQTLGTSNGTWSGAVSYAYQWQRCDSSGGACADISGATAATYKLTTDDVGSTIVSVVTASNARGSVSSASSPTSAVAGGSPANLTAPAVSGSAIEAWTVTADLGSWSNSPTLTDAWQRCSSTDPASCRDIPDATDTTYVLSADDVEQRVRVVVTGTNSVGSGSAASSMTDVVSPLEIVPPPDVSSLSEDGVVNGVRQTYSGAKAQTALTLPPQAEFAYNGPYISATKWIDAGDGNYYLSFERRDEPGVWEDDVYPCEYTAAWPNNDCGTNSDTWTGGFPNYLAYRQEIWNEFAGGAQTAGGLVPHTGCPTNDIDGADSACYRIEWSPYGGPAASDQTDGITIDDPSTPASATPISPDGPVTDSSSYTTSDASDDDTNTPSGLTVVTSTAPGTWALSGAVEAEPDDNVIPGATVVLSQVPCDGCPGSDFTPLVATVSNSGAFAFINVPQPADGDAYQLDVTASGYGNYTLDHVQAAPNATLQTTVMMSNQVQTWHDPVTPFASNQTNATSPFENLLYASQTMPPPMIKVAEFPLYDGSDGSGDGCAAVTGAPVIDRLFFRTRFYVLHVAANEIGPYHFPEEAVKANMAAELAYAWNWMLIRNDASAAAVDNSTRYQCFARASTISTLWLDNHQTPTEQWNPWLTDVLGYRMLDGSQDIKQALFKGAGSSICATATDCEDEVTCTSGSFTDSPFFALSPPQLSQWGTKKAATPVADGGCGMTDDIGSPPSWQKIATTYYGDTTFPLVDVPWTPKPQDLVANNTSSMIKGVAAPSSGAISFKFDSTDIKGFRVGWNYKVVRSTVWNGGGGHTICCTSILNPNGQGWPTDRFTYTPPTGGGGSSGRCYFYRVQAWNPRGPTPFAEITASANTVPDPNHSNHRLICPRP